MTVKIEISDAHDLIKHSWSGGRDTLNDLTYDEIETVFERLEDIFSDDPDATETDVNDYLWFERDEIAEWLGYADYEELLNDRD